MGRIKDLINIFLKPNEIEGEFDELAVASGLSQEEIKELNKTMNGVNWTRFAREDEEEKKNAKTSRKKIRVEPNIDQIKSKQINKGRDIER